LQITNQVDIDALNCKEYQKYDLNLPCKANQSNNQIILGCGQVWLYGQGIVNKQGVRARVFKTRLIQRGTTGYASGTNDIRSQRHEVRINAQFLVC